jgi:lysophospholipase L1-like esterase
MVVRRSFRAFLLAAVMAAASAGALLAQTPTAAPPPSAPTATAPPPAGGGPATLAGLAQAGGGRGRGGPGAPVVIGPPAPVPAAVAMLRPSASELAQINDALTRFVSADKSAASPLLKKYQSILMLQPPRLNTAATYTQTTQRMGPRHEGFVETAKQGNIDLLLHGDSITDWWVQGDENKAMFDKYFGRIRTANFAIAGDTTQGVLWGLKNGEGQGFQPKAVMVMIGTNNGQNTAPEVAEGIGAVVQEMRHNFPNAKILLLAVFPRSTPGDPVREKLAEVNRIISRLDDQRNVFYLDIGSKFLDEKGFFLANSFRTDNLHPQALGYDIWGQAVQAKLAELLK